MRERRSFEPERHPIGARRDPVRRRLQRVECAGGEVLPLRAGQNTDRRAPFGYGQNRFSRHRSRCARRSYWLAKRQLVASFERPAAQASHCADEVSGATPEDFWQRNPSRDRQVGARAARTAPKAQPRTVGHVKRRAHRRRTSIDRELEFRTRDGHQPLVVELQLRSDQRHLEGRLVGIISRQRVRETMRAGIHGAGDGHTARLKPPPAPVLNRRQHPRLDDVQPAHVSDWLPTAHRTGRDRSDRTERRRRPSREMVQDGKDRTT